MGLSLKPSDEIMQDIVAELDETSDADPIISLYVKSSSSMMPPTESGKTSSSSQSSSNVFNDLKDVSTFLKYYEKRKSRKSQKAQERAQRNKITRSENEESSNNRFFSFIIWSIANQQYASWDETEYKTETAP